MHQCMPAAADHSLIFHVNDMRNQSRRKDQPELYSCPISGRWEGYQQMKRGKGRGMMSEFKHVHAHPFSHSVIDTSMSGVRAWRESAETQIQLVLDGEEELFERASDPADSAALESSSLSRNTLSVSPNS
eukprot:3429230-Rhodomonas_salina.2